MGVAIACVLESDVAGVPHMEGKNLALAYVGGFDDDADADSDSAGDDLDDDADEDSEDSSDERLLEPLDPFISEGRAAQWHDAGKGLIAVRGILRKLRDGAKVAATKAAMLDELDDEELTEGVQFDLEELEQILAAAKKASVRFHLAVDA